MKNEKVWKVVKWVLIAIGILLGIYLIAKLATDVGVLVGLIPAGVGLGGAGLGLFTRNSRKSSDGSDDRTASGRIDGVSTELAGIREGLEANASRLDSLADRADRMGLRVEQMEGRAGDLETGAKLMATGITNSIDRLDKAGIGLGDTANSIAGNIRSGEYTVRNPDGSIYNPDTDRDSRTDSDPG